MVSEPHTPRSLIGLWILAALLVLLVGLGAALIGTEAGARLLFTRILQAPGLHIEGVTGVLVGPLRIARLTADSTNQTVVLRDLRIDWRPQALLGGRLHVTSLRLGDLQVTSKIKQQPEPLLLPERIALPLDLQIDQVLVEGGDIRKGPLSLVKLGAFGFRLEFDGARYLLQLDRLNARGASASGDFSGQATLSAIKPYAVQAEIISMAKAQVAQQALGANARVALSGSLAELLANIDLTVNAARVTGALQLRPFSPEPLGSANLSARGLDLALLHEGLPKTRLNIALRADEHGKGQLTAHNAVADTIDRQGVPLTDLVLDFAQSEGRFVFPHIAVALGSNSQSAGGIEGSGKFDNGALTLALNVNAVNMQRLDRRAIPTRLMGQVRIDAADGKQQFNVALRDAGGRNNLSLRADASLADNAVAVERAELRVAAGRVTAAGKIALDGAQAFALDGTMQQLRLQDLGNFAQLPALALSGDFKLAGARVPQLTAALEFHLHDSLLAGRPLSGEGNVLLRADAITVPKLLLIAADNRLTMQGALAQGQSTLQFALDAPALAQLGPGFGGALSASGTLRGRFAAPELNLAWSGNQVRLPGAIGIAAMQGSARVQIDPRQPFSIDTVLLDMTASGIKSANAALAGVSAHVALSPRAQAPLEVAIAATGLDAAGFRSDALTLNASGTTARHTLSARSNDTAQRWSIGASGGLVALRPELRWDGRIDIVDGVGQYAVKLQAPAALSVAQQRVTLDDFALQVDGMTLAIDRFLRDDSGIVTRGRVTHVAAATLLKLVKPAPAISGDLQLGGTWDIKLADALNGSVHVAREQGDLSMRGSTPVALGLTQLQLDVGAVDGRLSARLQADGAQLGRIAMTAASNSGRGEARLTLAPDAALSANASIAIPSLNWVGPMIAPAVVTAGQLQSEIAVSGTVAAPRFNGKLSGSGLRVFLADEGIDLRNGVLDSSFDGERLVVQQLRFEQAGGSLQASGPINLTAGQPEALIALKADHFALLDRSDRKLVISGQSDITWRDQRASISGTVRADSGSFDLGRADAPQLSDDVVIVGRGQQGGGRTVAALDLTFDLGDGVALTGRGIEARLAGKLHITSSGREALRAQGTLAFEQGTYNAYGRKLAIEQGVMRFNGPLNNPSLDILAMRRGGEVEAGVAVRGSVLLPRITLVSEPTVSDAEKLSWLVLGKGLDSAGTGDAGVLQAAAATLLSQSAAAGVQSRLSSTFGLENFSVGKSTDSLQQRIVTVGKQISARLYVSYEQGLESANSVLHLRYTLTPKLTLEAEAGARSALSLFYNILFD